MSIPAMQVAPAGFGNAAVNVQQAAGRYTRTALGRQTAIAAQEDEATKARLRALERMITRQKQGELITGLLTLVGAGVGAAGVLGGAGGLAGAAAGARAGGAMGALAGGAAPARVLPELLGDVGALTTTRPGTKTPAGTVLGDPEETAPGFPRAAFAQGPMGGLGIPRSRSPMGNPARGYWGEMARRWSY